MSNKTRLDVLLTEQGLQESRQKAQATIMSGLVFVNGQRVDKPGTAVAEDAQIEVRGGTLAYVSRGGIGNFVPMNANFGIVKPLDVRVKGGKAARNEKLSERALDALAAMQGR